MADEEDARSRELPVDRALLGIALSLPRPCALAQIDEPLQ
jgi:hypothetical protein